MPLPLLPAENKFNLICKWNNWKLKTNSAVAYKLIKENAWANDA